jgi:hypothetical protein
MTSVASVAPAKVVATSPTYLHYCLRRLADGSRAPTPEGSLPACAWGDVATPIRPATGRPSLAPPSFTRSPIGSPCGSLSLAGGLRAYHVPQVESSWGGRWCLFAGGASSACEEFGAPQPGHVPFWSKPVSLFGLFWDDGVYRRFTLRSSCPRSWLPTALRLAVAVSAHAFTTLTRGGGGYVVPRASHEAVASNARRGRRRMAKHSATSCRHHE